jgi:hypothetical protein
MLNIRSVGLPLEQPSDRIFLRTPRSPGFHSFKSSLVLSWGRDPGDWVGTEAGARREYKDERGNGGAWG